MLLSVGAFCTNASGCKILSYVFSAKIYRNRLLKKRDKKFTIKEG